MKLSPVGRRRAMGLGAAGLLLARTNAASSQQTPLRLELRLDDPDGTARYPAGPSGLSLETSVLAAPGVLVPSNRALIDLHRGLSGAGILRLGGNMSDRCWFQSAPDVARPTMRDGSTTTPRRYVAITPDAVHALAAFVEQTGWSVVWGLNLGTGTAEQAAREAAAVRAILGDRLLAFQIGNEPDLFNRYGHGMRGADWDLPRFLVEWEGFARAVLRSCPDARFWGPDVAIEDGWVAGFARWLAAGRNPLAAVVDGLSAHYYAEGPPSAANSTIQFLLSDDPRTAERLSLFHTLPGADRRPFYLSEVGSCFLGGKPGVSDTFASALWATDYVLRMTANGCGGVLFHGGAAEVQDANDGRTTGARNRAEHRRALDGAFYSPIAGTTQSGFRARPMYRGLQLANALGGATRLGCRVDGAPWWITAYAGQIAGTTRVVLVNRDQHRAAFVTLPDRIRGPARTTLQRLTAPALDAPDGVRFTEDRMPAPGQSLAVPSASAALLTIG